MIGSQWGRARTETVLDALARAASDWADEVYLDMCGDRTYSFAEIDSLSNRFAHGLAAMGVGPGTAVATMLDNSADCIAIFYAVMKVQALLVPLNTGLKGEFLRHQLADSSAILAICEADYADRFEAVLGEVPALANLLIRDGADGLAGIVSDSTAPLSGRPKPSDIAMLLYTSGTTGLSKACMIGHGYIARYIGNLEYSARLSPAERLYTAAPLFHVGALGMALTSPICGNRLVLERRFTVQGFWPEIRRSGATVTNIVGAMIPLLAQAPDSADSRACHGQLKYNLGMPFTPDLTRIWQERFGMTRAYNSGFGMSEACLIFITPPDETPPPGSSGKAAPDMDVRMMDDDGNECPPGVAGEMVVRPMAPGIMFSGYWNRPEETAKAFENLWFHTGDIGYLDADGWFYFVDRKKDYIRRRGENISTFELEAVFRKHPALADVAVHAVPSELTEDDVKLTAVLHAPGTANEEDICRWAEDKVPFFALPRYIEFRTALPYNASAKALKYKLREEGVTPQTWDREKSAFRGRTNSKPV
jgi:crotonobetaine/carnitine-CoA ligase